MSVSRRTFLKAAGSASLAFGGLGRVLASEEPASAALWGGSPSSHRSPGSGGPAVAADSGFGPLLEDPRRVVDLPEGFTYTLISSGGERMDDGFFVPRRHDGMAAFPGPEGKTILVRNHELDPGADPGDGPFGAGNELLARWDPRHLYDPGVGGGPALGGTTNLLFDTGTQTLIEHRLSLAGTLRNCAGGPTPWGTWITCEESVHPAARGMARAHGYAFEVPAVMPPGPVEPAPLRAMGRFYREAVAVQPGTSIVYQTEDLGDGLLYRFVPDVPGRLEAGGRLQALAVRGRAGLRTQNWSGRRRIRRGETVEVEWIDLEDPENPGDDLRERGAARGAARFARAEGIWFGRDELYVACTDGGAARRGQIWRYVPSPREGTAAEESAPGRLQLFLEAERTSLLRRADNLTMAPWGDLIVCEDGGGVDRLLGVTPEGTAYLIARNATGAGEMAGSTFSPDGTTLFVNLQEVALTAAITGPWEERGSRG